MGEAFLDYKKGGSGLDINGIIEDYYVYAGEKVSAGDFVEFINGVASKVDYGTSSSAVFLNSNLQNICSCLIDTNKVLVVFGDYTASNCKAVVATVNGAEITYGTIYTVNSTKVDYISMTFVSANKVAISYSYEEYLAQVAIITVSGTAITVGNTLTVGSGSSSYPDYWTQVIALDETHLLATWDRSRNSSSTTYGLKACVLTINNTTLSAGIVLSLEGYQHHSLSLCKLNSTSAILFYNDAQNSEYGTARVLQISGTTITSGSEYVFQNSRTLYISSCLVDTNKVMMSYCDNGNSNTGKAIIAQVSGTSVTFGSVYTLPINRQCGGMATIDTNKAILAYRDKNEAGTAVTATVSGTVIEFGTPYTFSNLINNVYFGVIMINNDTALVAYANYVDSTSKEGTAQLLGVSDTEISNNITDTTYETQVRLATSLPCKGVAKSSGEGGDDTGHKDIVSIYVPNVPKYVDFTSSIVPTTWVDSSDYLSATATNEYGEWVCGANTFRDETVVPSKAFDGTGTPFISATLNDDTTEEFVYLNCPTGVSINPTSITVEYGPVKKNESKVQGYNDGKWADLAVLSNFVTSNTTQTYAISVDTYYSAFRCLMYRASANYAQPQIHEFTITSGTLKIEA